MWENLLQHKQCQCRSAIYCPICPKGYINNLMVKISCKIRWIRRWERLWESSGCLFSHMYMTFIWPFTNLQIKEVFLGEWIKVVHIPLRNILHMRFHASYASEFGSNEYNFFSIHKKTDLSLHDLMHYIFFVDLAVTMNSSNVWWPSWSFVVKLIVSKYCNLINLYD